MVAWFAAVIASLLGIFPILHYLCFGRRERRREILDLLDDKAIGRYFDLFYRAKAKELKKDPAQRLAGLYDERFGLRTFVLPLIIYVPTLCLVVLAIVSTAADDPKLVALPAALAAPAAAYALAGAYVWVVLDLINRSRQRNLVPSALYFGIFRFLFSIPLATAVGAALNQALAAPVGFLLGAFPLDTLLSVMRKLGSQKIGLSESKEPEKRELATLQGMTTAIAETFADLGVTTLVQFAYDDPIQLAMRTNLSFYFVLDIASQALAANYLDLTKARKYSLRGAVEVTSLVKALQGETGPRFENANAVVKALAHDLVIPEAALLIILQQISGDPCAEFQCAIWEGEREKPGESVILGEIIVVAED